MSTTTLPGSGRADMNSLLGCFLWLFHQVDSGEWTSLSSQAFDWTLNLVYSSSVQGDFKNSSRKWYASTHALDLYIFVPDLSLNLSLIYIWTYLYLFFWTLFGICIQNPIWVSQGCYQLSLCWSSPSPQELSPQIHCKVGLRKAEAELEMPASPPTC